MRLHLHCQANKNGVVGFFTTVFSMLFLRPRVQHHGYAELSPTSHKIRILQCMPAIQGHPQKPTVAMSASLGPCNNNLSGSQNTHAL